MYSDMLLVSISENAILPANLGSHELLNAPAPDMNRWRMRIFECFSHSNNNSFSRFFKYN